MSYTNILEQKIKEHCGVFINIINKQMTTQTKNRLAYLKRKRRKLLTECRNAGVELTAEYKQLTHDITVCELNLMADE